MATMMLIQIGVHQRLLLFRSLAQPTTPLGLHHRFIHRSHR